MLADNGLKTTKLQLARTTSGRSRSLEITMMGNWRYLPLLRTVLTRLSTFSSALFKSMIKAWCCSFIFANSVQSSEAVRTKRRSISSADDSSARMIDFLTSALSVRITTVLPATDLWKAFMSRRACWLSLLFVLEFLRVAALSDCEGPPANCEANFRRSEEARRSSDNSSLDAFNLGSRGTEEALSNGGGYGSVSSRSGSVKKMLLVTAGDDPGWGERNFLLELPNRAEGTASAYLALTEMLSPIGF
mmetsp:Transcript_36832/g.59336  ORF Transcript_36832/g.59336 Transcript_36832/m.59336 type:complete len:247 (-) Transcript_36832:561-1301(-)